MFSAGSEGSGPVHVPVLMWVSVHISSMYFKMSGVTVFVDKNRAMHHNLLNRNLWPGLYHLEQFSLQPCDGVYKMMVFVMCGSKAV